MSMKSKILGITLLLVAGSASAQHFRHHGHHGHWVHSGGSNWVPALIAGGGGGGVPEDQLPWVLASNPG